MQRPAACGIVYLNGGTEIMKSIHIGNIELYIERDKESYVSIHTDGYTHEAIAPLLAALLPRLRAAGLALAPLCIVRHARVALQDEVGSLLRARLSLMLLGERPGLGTPDSLGAYFTFDPRPGRTDAERNCLSNIRPAGLPPAAAAEKLATLITTALRLGLTGTALKDDQPPPAAALSRAPGSALDALPAAGPGEPRAHRPYSSET